MPTSEDVTELLRELYLAWLVATAERLPLRSKHDSTREDEQEKEFRRTPLASLVRLLWHNRARVPQTDEGAPFGYAATRDAVWCELKSLPDLLHMNGEAFRTLNAMSKRAKDIFRPKRPFSTLTKKILSLDEATFAWNEVRLSESLRDAATEELGSKEASDEGRRLRIPLGGSVDETLWLGLRTREQMANALVVSVGALLETLEEASQETRGLILADPGSAAAAHAATRSRKKRFDVRVPPAQEPSFIRMLSPIERATMLRNAERGIPLFRARLLGVPSKDVQVPDRLLLRGVPGAGKTVTALLLLERDDRDVIVIEQIADPADAVNAATRGLPILFENATRDDARTLMRIAQRLGLFPFIVTTSDETFALPGFKNEHVPDTDRLFFDDVVTHCEQYFGISLPYDEVARIVDHLTAERLETMAGVLHHAARAFGHRVPYDSAPLVERWRTRLPTKDTERRHVLRAIGELWWIPRDNLPIQRRLLDRYLRAHNIDPGVLEALHDEGWVFLAGDYVHVPEVQGQTLQGVLWEPRKDSIAVWLATTDDPGIDPAAHEEWLTYLWRRFHLAVRDNEHSDVANARDKYRRTLAGHLAQRLQRRYGPLPEFQRAITTARQLGLLPDDQQ